MKNQILLYTILIFASGCVSKKKYDQVVQSKEVLQNDFNRMRGAERERLIYADSLVRLNIRLAGAVQEADEWKNRYYSIETTLKDVNKELASLKYQNEQLQLVASSNNDALRQQIEIKCANWMPAIRICVC